MIISQKSKQTVIRIVGIAVGMAMIVYGIFLGEPNTVMRKAVTICLECIGIG